ncbi:consensus disorder prediction [Desulfoluna spongiiphila]|nr:consensus disorder prediction [Desulfoluna spongiiphila]
MHPFMLASLSLHPAGGAELFSQSLKRGGDKIKMKQALSVMDPASGKRVRHEKVVLICHGLALSPGDEEIDKEFACLIMRTLIPDFSDGIDVEYIFAKSRDGDAAARKMMTLSKRRGLDAFILPDVQAMVMQVALGLAFPATKGREPVVVLVSQDETDDFRARVRVDSVGEPAGAMNTQGETGDPVPDAEPAPPVREGQEQKRAEPPPAVERAEKVTASPRNTKRLAWKLMTIGLCALAGFLYYRLLMLLCGMAYSFFWEGALRGGVEKAGGHVGVLIVLVLVIAMVPSVREEWREVFGWICIAFAIPAFIGAISFYSPAELAGFQAIITVNARSVVLIAVGLLLILSGALFVRLKP